MTGRLGRRYARALIALAREDGMLEPYGEELGRALAAFEEPRLRLLLMSPVIDAAVRRQTSRSVIAVLGLSKTVSNLLSLLVDGDRLPVLPDVVRAYEAQLDEELGRARVTIRSASPLGGAERAEMTELARRLTGRREVIATTEVDAELLGGVVLDVGGTVYDGSVRTQLARLGKEMGEGGA